MRSLRWTPTSPQAGRVVAGHATRFFAKRTPAQLRGTTQALRIQHRNFDFFRFCRARHQRALMRKSRKNPKADSLATGIAPYLSPISIVMGLSLSTGSQFGNAFPLGSPELAKFTQ
jgi:hypothetical protein